MAEHEPHPLEFRCGACAKPLTDENALFTSCGHFFCAPCKTIENSNCCTSLSLENRGHCEQCGTFCNAGILRNKAAGYDDRVKSFVFGNAALDLRRLAEIFEVSGTFRSLLFSLDCQA